MKTAKRMISILCALLISLSMLAFSEDGVDFSDMFSGRDGRYEYKENGAVKVHFTPDGASATDESVLIDGAHVTLTEESVYIVSGENANGSLTIDMPSDAKVQVVLDGLVLKNGDGAALHIIKADKVFLTLAPGSENTLENGGEFKDRDTNKVDAVIFSKQDLTMNGTGKLTVLSPAGHGIACKDDFVVSGAELVIECAEHAVEANDSIRIRDAYLTLTAGKDGLHSEHDEKADKGFVYIESGNIHIKAEGDGISAGAYLYVADGEIAVTAGGGNENGTKASSGGWGGYPGGMGRYPGNSSQNDSDSTSMKGLKAAGKLTVAGGTLTLDTADDALHSDHDLLIESGSITIATGDDALHAENTLTVKNGTILISQSYEGLEAHYIYVEGGNLTLTASDDGLNAAGGNDASGTAGGRDGKFGGRGGMFTSGSSDGKIVISGGSLYIVSSGDGIDANGTLEITGGYTVITGPNQGDTASLDYDISGVITGGTFIGTGARGMAQSFSGAEQGVLAVSVGSGKADTAIVVTDAEENVLLNHIPELPYSVIIYSSPSLISGESYNITIGDISGVLSAY